jgi:hypothetical protein
MSTSIVPEYPGDERDLRISSAEAETLASKEPQVPPQKKQGVARIPSEVGFSTKYTVYFDDYTKSHYIKKFPRKYSQKAWDITELALRGFGESIELVLLTDQVKLIHTKSTLSIQKLYFSVAGTKVGYKDSCCRVILAIDSIHKSVTFLLVYHKDHLPGKGGETVQWQRIIEENFPEYSELI